MPAPSDFISLGVLITPAWIFIGSALGMHALWSEQMTKGRKLALFLYGAVSIVLIIGSWWSGASQEAHNEAFEASVKKIADALHLAPNISAQDLADEILRRLGSRDIDDATATAIISDLRAVSPHTVTVVANSDDSEVKGYTWKLAGILVRGGWSVPNNNIPINIGATPLEGIFIEYKSADHIPAAANQLAVILTNHGIAVQGKINPAIADAESFTLLVGSARRR